MKTTIMADVCGLAMVAAAASLPLGCVPVPQPAAASDLQADIAVYGQYSLMVSGAHVVPAPSPAPEAGCTTGCRCNGSGVEPTGDGLARVPCRCPDSCSCKAKKETSPCQSGTCPRPTRPTVR